MNTSATAVSVLPAVGDAYDFAGVAGKIIHIRPLYESGEPTSEYGLTIKLSHAVPCVLENGRYRRPGRTTIVGATVRFTA